MPLSFVGDTAVSWPRATGPSNHVRCVHGQGLPVPALIPRSDVHTQVKACEHVGPVGLPGQWVCLSPGPSTPRSQHRLAWAG